MEVEPDVYRVKETAGGMVFSPARRWAMELNQYFSICILAVCVIHLAVTIGGQIHNWGQAFMVRKQLLLGQPAQAAKGVAFSTKTTKQQRSDWYVFFHCSDLVGKSETEKTAPSLSQEIKPLRPQTYRPSAKRPENRLTLT
ncbi:MAG: hypothetical protein KJ630_00805 [Proteobacteria bacterium]|nr:hypothetical protein [Pseudomonadota bacterium]